MFNLFKSLFINTGIPSVSVTINNRLSACSGLLPLLIRGASTGSHVEIAFKQVYDLGWLDHLAASSIYYSIVETFTLMTCCYLYWWGSVTAVPTTSHGRGSYFDTGCSNIGVVCMSQKQPWLYLTRLPLFVASVKSGSPSEATIMQAYTMAAVGATVLNYLIALFVGINPGDTSIISGATVVCMSIVHYAYTAIELENASTFLLLWKQNVAPESPSP